MVAEWPGPGPRPRGDEVGLGAALRKAWIGYRRQLDAELAAAGFGDRSFPDGRVLRMCVRSTDVTVSEIGRQLGMSRQGAAKIVGGLRARGYVTLSGSATDRREKVLVPTARAAAFLVAQRNAARRVERRLRADIGAEALAALRRLVDALDGDGRARLRTHHEAVGVPGTGEGARP